MIETIFVDVDETLIDHNFKIPAENVEAIRKAQDKGVEVLLCTGRMIAGLRYIIDELNIKDLIAMNGAIIYGDHGNEVLYRKTMDNNLVQKIFDFGIDNNESIHIFTQDELYIHNMMLDEKKRYEQMKFHYTLVDTLEPVKEPVIKMIFQNDDIEHLESLENRLRAYVNEPIELTFSSHRYMEINPIGTSKGNAIERYLNMKNKSLETSMIIGDSPNDLSKFQLNIGKKVAVANAVDIIKQHAHIITEKDASNGAVAEAINRFVL